MTDIEITSAVDPEHRPFVTLEIPGRKKPLTVTAWSARVLAERLLEVAAVAEHEASLVEVLTRHGVHDNAVVNIINDARNVRDKRKVSRS